MKKFLIALLAMLMIFAFVSCDDKHDPVPVDPDPIDPVPEPVVTDFNERWGTDFDFNGIGREIIDLAEEVESENPGKSYLELTEILNDRLAEFDASVFWYDETELAIEVNETEEHAGAQYYRGDGYWTIRIFDGTFVQYGGPWAQIDVATSYIANFPQVAGAYNLINEICLSANNDFGVIFDVDPTVAQAQAYFDSMVNEVLPSWGYVGEKTVNGSVWEYRGSNDKCFLIYTYVAELNKAGIYLSLIPTLKEKTSEVKDADGLTKGLLPFIQSVIGDRYPQKEDIPVLEEAFASSSQFSNVTIDYETDGGYTVWFEDNDHGVTVFRESDDEYWRVEGYWDGDKSGWGVETAIYEGQMGGPLTDEFSQVIDTVPEVFGLNTFSYVQPGIQPEFAMISLNLNVPNADNIKAVLEDFANRIYERKYPKTYNVRNQQWYRNGVFECILKDAEDAKVSIHLIYIPKHGSKEAVVGLEYLRAGREI